MTPRTSSLPLSLAPVGVQPAAAATRAASWVVATLLVLVLVPAAWAVSDAATPWSVLVLVLVAPLLEELVFRGGVQELLHRRGWPAWPAVLATTAAFALAHGFARSWILAAAVVPASLLLGGLYARTRRVGPVFGLHALLNFLWLALASAVPGLSVSLLR